MADKIKITDENVRFIIADLRDFYRDNFRNGVSDESFIMWIEQEIEAV